MARFKQRDFSTSLYFNAAAYVRKNSASVYGTTGYSISLWVKATPTDAGDFLYGEGSSASNNTKVGIRTGTTSIRSIGVLIRNDANTSLLAVETVARPLDGNWHHIVFTDNNGDCVMYIDAVADATNFDYTPSGTFTITDTAVGAMYGNGGGGSAASQMKGFIDDVRLFSSALTAQQVSDLYFEDVNPSTPYLWWKFDEGSGTTASDSSGNSRTGTITTATYSTDVAFKPRTAI